jgi:phosphate:Na+ symporter
MDYQDVLFKFFGGLAIFLFGMNLMSDGLKKIGSESFKRFLQTLTKHRFTAIFVGLVITCAIQSSSATSVMVVGFINAGLLAFEQGVAVVLGADIGTTITAWIVSALGIGKFKLAAYALPVIAVGFVINLSARSRKKKMIGQALLGFGLLFLGLGTMADGIAPVKKSPVVHEVFAACGHNPFLGVLAGTVATMIIQSSSATIAIVQVMASQGVFDLDTALPLMLGDNIGTTITAQLAAIGGTKGARGMAMANSLFKIFGTALFLPLLLMGVYQDGIRLLISDGTAGANGINSTIMVQIAVAHSAFNIINTAIFSMILWPLLIKSARKVSFGKGSFEDEKKDLLYLDPLLLANPPMAIEQCARELGYMTRQAHKNIVASFNAFLYGNVNTAA